MHIAVVGKGAREDVICRLIRAQHPECEISCAPGSDGIAQTAKVLPFFRLDTPITERDRLLREIEAFSQWAAGSDVDLVIVGPEDPLAAGIVDRLEAYGVTAFGPTMRAAEAEWSKAFAKKRCWEWGIPTAPGEVILHPTEAGLRHVAQEWRDEQGRVVVKASGLAAGKAARITKTGPELAVVIHDMLLARIYGDKAVESIVVEKFMDGEEASLFVICDGDDGVPLIPAQDHKRIGLLVAPGVGEGDEGLNTGGMGAYAPAPVMTQALIAETMESIVRPFLRGMRDLGRPYRGVLYVGLMITPDGPKVVEFNCRFGDPEVQVILPVLDSSFVGLCMAAARGTLYEAGPVRFARDRAAACVVMASGGYPGSYAKGKVISGLDEFDQWGDLMAFHAGTKLQGETWLTDGGRVADVTALGADIPSAVDLAYEGIGRLSFDDAYFRRDIAHRALNR